MSGFATRTFKGWESTDAAAAATLSDGHRRNLHGLNADATTLELLDCLTKHHDHTAAMQRALLASTAPSETSPSPPTRTWPLTDTPPRHPRNIGVDHLNVEHEKQLQDDALTRQLLHDEHSVHHAKDEMGSDDEEELLAFCKELRPTGQG